MIGKVDSKIVGNGCHVGVEYSRLYEDDKGIDLTGGAVYLTGARYIGLGARYI